MSQPAQQGVVVTLGEIYSQVQATDKKVDQLAGKFDLHRDHEERLRTLEKKVWIASGVAAALSGGVVQALNTALGG